MAVDEQFSHISREIAIASSTILCYDPNMAEKKKDEPRPSLKRELLKQMVSLSTSGFGLVAALAWNNVIQEFVSTYVKKILPDGSGILSLLLYAILITALAVTVTYQLSKLIDENK